jgi:Threonine dehydrogenase and related Zn-dependent dehydrogenases
MDQKTQKALVYTAPREYGLYDVPVPEIVKPTDAIVRVTLSTICGSDVHIVAGGSLIMPLSRLGHDVDPDAFLPYAFWKHDDYRLVMKTW